MLDLDHDHRYSSESPLFICSASLACEYSVLELARKLSAVAGLSCGSGRISYPRPSSCA